MRWFFISSVLLSIFFLTAIPVNAQVSDYHYGLSRMTNLSALPLLDRNVKVHYEGSIDKEGKNADWDCLLYQDKSGEWVLFDVKGAGCIYNFAQHRYIDSEVPEFRFYFDGENIPRFTIRTDQFGEKHPFIEPLASRYIGPLDNGRGPIRVIRSFVPMPFREGCRITSSLPLKGFQRIKGEGGWGHVIYHSFTDTTGIQTFTGKEMYEPLVQLWKTSGSDPKANTKMTKEPFPGKEFSPGERLILLDKEGAGCLSALRLYIEDMIPDRLHDIWIHLSWDNHAVPDVSCPIGCLFGNSLGYNDTNYLLMGASKDGWFYNYFPMPFWNHASIVIENRSHEKVSIGFAEATLLDNTYDHSHCGYFRSSTYYERKHTPESDSPIGTLHGTGKLVAAHVTAYAKQPGVVSCEGDVRIYIDGNRTPQIESDGSESYSCYGWGFPTPSETNPSSGYDGFRDNPWSMTRLCIGDSYPFYSNLRFGIESGGNNDQYLEHSGCLFYYGKDDISLIATDSVDLGDKRSVRKHRYKVCGNVTENELVSFFEGDDDHLAVKGKVHRFDGQSSFTVTIAPENEGVRLLRRSDQKESRQCARVWIDDQEITERLWYFADHNPHKRWLEDEFEIPAQMTRGKSSLNITIEPIAFDEGNPTWNESYYTVFCYKK